MKRVLEIAGMAIAALLLVAIGVSFLVDANRFRPLLESKLSQALGRDVKVGNLHIAIFSGGLTADDIAIADDPAFGSSAFLQAKAFHARVDLAALILSRTIAVTAIRVDQPEIRLLQSPAGEWNISTLGTKSAAPSAPSAQGNESQIDLSVKLVTVANGRLTLARTASHFKPVELDSVNIEVHDFAPDRAFPFSASMSVAGGGAVKLDGNAGPIDRGDVALTPASLNLHIARLDLAGSGLNEIAPALAGLVSFDGSGQSGANGVDLTGKLKVEKWKVAAKGTPANRALELDFHIAHDLKKRSGRVHQGDIHLGSAVTRLTGTYTPQGDSFAVDMTLDGPRMPVEELQSMLPAIGMVLPNGSSLRGGTASAKATIHGPVDSLTIDGSLTMNDTQLAGFNLSSRMSAIEKLAGIKTGPDTEIQQLSGDVRMAPDGITAANLKLAMPAIGDVSGAGTIAPDNALSFKLTALVHATGLAAALSRQPVPFNVTGTCADPVFRPDVAGVVKGDVKGLVRGLLGEKKK